MEPHNLHLDRHRVVGGGRCLQQLQGVVGVEFQAARQAEHGGQGLVRLRRGEPQLDHPLQHGGDRRDDAGAARGIEGHQIDHRIAGFELLNGFGSAGRAAGVALAIGVLGLRLDGTTGLAAGEREGGGVGPLDQLPGTTAGGLLEPAPDHWIGDAIHVAQFSGEGLPGGADAGEYQHARGIHNRRWWWWQRRPRGATAQIDLAISELEPLHAAQRIGAGWHGAARQGSHGGDPRQGIGADLVVAAVAVVDGGIHTSAALEDVVAAAAFEVIVATAAVDGVVAAAAVDDVAATGGITVVVTTEQINGFTGGVTGHVIAAVGAHDRRTGDQSLTRRVAGAQTGDVQATVVDVIAGVSDGDLDGVEGPTADDRGHDAQHATDTVVFNRQRTTSVVLEIARCQVGRDHTQRPAGILLKQRIIHAIDDDDGAINKGIHPLGVLIRAKNQIKADGCRGRIRDAKIKGQRRGVVRLGLKDLVDHGVDIRIAVLKTAAEAVVLPEPAHGVAQARHLPGGEQQACPDPEGRERAVVQAHRRLGGRLQADASGLDGHPQQGIHQCSDHLLGGQAIDGLIRHTRDRNNGNKRSRPNR